MRFLEFYRRLCEASDAHPDFPRKIMNPAEKKALKDYSGDGHKYARPKSRETLDHLIRTGPWTPKDHTLYRGLDQPPKMDKDGHHTHTQLTSTSTREDKARNFAVGMSRPGGAHHVVRIHVPAKSRVLRNHETDDDGNHEHEVLLGKGSKIKYNKTPTEETHNVTSTSHTADGEVTKTEPKKFTIWHAKMVHDGTSNTGR